MSKPGVMLWKSHQYQISPKISVQMLRIFAKLFSYKNRSVCLPLCSSYTKKNKNKTKTLLDQLSLKLASSV